MPVSPSGYLPSVAADVSTKNRDLTVDDDARVVDTRERCPDMDIDTRIAKLEPWHEWLRSRGSRDYPGQTYPYSNLQPAELQSLADAGDAQALQTLGLKQIWSATRAHGTVRPTTLFEAGGIAWRDPIDLEQLEIGVTLLEQAAIRGLEMAYLSLSRELLFVFHRQREVGSLTLAQIVLWRARIEAYGEMPEQLYPALHDSFHESRVFDEVRIESERLIGELVVRHHATRAALGLPEHQSELPDSYYADLSDDWCLQ
ncbi:MAG: hypothetical protein AAF004_05430 [Pseudomonadota bacterium]